MFNDAGQRIAEFSDVQLSVNTTANEQFWYMFSEEIAQIGNPDAHLFYAASTQYIAQSFGRVTCGVGGETRNSAYHGRERHLNYQPGSLKIARGLRLDRMLSE